MDSLYIYKFALHVFYKFNFTFTLSLPSKSFAGGISKVTQNFYLHDISTCIHQTKLRYCTELTSHELLLLILYRWALRIAFRQSWIYGSCFLIDMCMCHLNRLNHKLAYLHSNKLHQLLERFLLLACLCFKANRYYMEQIAMIYEIESRFRSRRKRVITPSSVTSCVLFSSDAKSNDLIYLILTYCNNIISENTRTFHYERS